MPHLIKFPDGRSVRPLDVERVTYNDHFVEGKTATPVWVVRMLITGGDDWIYRNDLATEEEAQELCGKLTDEINAALG
jgi:hypothetical protein